MQDAMAKIAAAAGAIEAAQNAVNALSTDDVPNRDQIAGALTDGYSSVARAQKLAQG